MSKVYVVQARSAITSIILGVATTVEIALEILNRAETDAARLGSDDLTTYTSWVGLESHLGIDVVDLDKYLKEKA